MGTLRFRTEKKSGPSIIDKKNELISVMRNNLHEAKRENIVLQKALDKEKKKVLIALALGVAGTLIGFLV